MNMQVGRVWTAPPPAGEGQGPAQSQRASRRLYLPTIVIASLAAWLSWRGWTALGQTGVGVVMLLLTAGLLWQRR